MFQDKESKFIKNKSPPSTTPIKQSPLTKKRYSITPIHERKSEIKVQDKTADNIQVRSQTPKQSEYNLAAYNVNLNHRRSSFAKQDDLSAQQLSNMMLVQRYRERLFCNYKDVLRKQKGSDDSIFLSKD